MSRKHFRVVSPDGVVWDRVAMAKTDSGRDVSLQVWTDAEWASLHPAERPDGAIDIPDIGRVLVLDLETEAQRNHAECLESEHRYRRGAPRSAATTRRRSRRPSSGSSEARGNCANLGKT